MKFIGFITYVNRSILRRKYCIVSQFSGQRTLDLLPARWQRFACKVKRAINCPLTRLIDRNKLRSIYIFLKNNNLLANDLLYPTIIEILGARKTLCVEIFSLMMHLFRATKIPMQVLNISFISHYIHITVAT